jgi:diguanylate cyclase (GGDEF)-like protein
MQRDVEQRAMTDALTGLANRGGMMRHLIASAARVRRHGGGFALAFLDLDGFKAVNDKYGHAAGDEVLVEIAKRAQAIARANDFLCRLGGDEFVFYLDGLHTRAKARQAAARYAAVVEKPMVLSAEASGARVALTASFGLAVCPKDSLDAHELMTVADHAMYERKRAKQASLAKVSPFRPMLVASKAS